MATGETSCSSTMDAKIWGELQSYIDLTLIYAKLPFREFFQLRLVCKDWNRLASDRMSFEDCLPKPYFALTAFDPEQQGLLTYEPSSKRWNWTRLPSRWSGHLEYTGLLLCSSTNEVFNVHTRSFYSLPPSSELTSILPYAGMIVDSSVPASVRPHSFQIIFGSNDIDTQIYDSGSDSWTRRLSKRSYHERENVVEPTISCVHCNGFVYLMACADYVDVLIETYDLERDEWGTLRPPGLDDLINYLGAWQGKLFFFKMDTICDQFTAWVLADRSKHEWAVYDRMSEELHSWITYADGPADAVNAWPTFATKFCHEYVLVYTNNWMDNSWLCRRCVLFRFDTKAWEKIELAELGLAV